MDEEKKDNGDLGVGAVNTNMNLKAAGSVSSRRPKEEYMDVTDDIIDKEISRSKKGN